MEDSKYNKLLIGIAIFCFIVIIILLFTGNDKKDIEVESIAINGNNVSLVLGETRQMSAIILPSNASDKGVKWESDNPNVVTVNNGLLIARSVGQAKITAKASNGKETNILVNVFEKEIKIEEMIMNEEDVSIVIGNIATLELVMTPVNATEEIEWTSSDPDVVAILDGVIFANKIGTALITAKSTSGKIAICDVEVIEKPIEATAIALNETSKTIPIGETFMLRATFEPSTTNSRTLKWTSSDPEVASVNNGAVLGLKEGETTITAETNNGIKASSVITVRKSGLKIKVASFNIGAYKCGTGNVHCTVTYKTFVNLIKKYEIDIIGMQEAEPEKSTNKIASTLGYNHYYVKPASANSTMSKFSILSKSKTSLVGCHESRVVTKTVIKINDVNVSFYNTHLSYQSGCPVKQVPRVLDIVKKDPNPAILVGDFNYSSSGLYDNYIKPSGLLLAAHNQNVNLTGKESYTDAVYVKDKDSNNVKRIFLVGEETVPTYKIYSDHNLVIATLEIVK